MIGKVRQFLFGTLRGRLIVGVAAVHAVMMALFISDLIARQRAILLDRQVEQATALSHSLATSGAGWIVASDVSGLQELAEAQRRYPELLFAVVTDLDGQVLAATDRSKRGKYLLDLPGKAVATVIAGTPMLVDVATPAVIGGRHVGWARVGIGQKLAEKKQAEIAWSGAVYGLGAILAGSVIAWFMGLRITRRLYAVQQTIDEIRSGNRLARSAITGSDEAAIMSREFNAMLDALDDRERELRMSEERYRSLMGKVQIAIVLYDAGRRILAFNPKAEELLGLSPDKLDSRIDDVMRFLREDGSDSPVAEDPVSRVLATGQPVRGHVAGVCRDGRDDVIWVLVCAEPELDEKGKVSQVIVSLMDISERKLAEEVLRTSVGSYRMAQAISHVGNWEYDLQTGEFWGSDEAKRIYGFDPVKDRFSTEDVEQCIPERERVHQALTALIDTGQLYNLEFEIRPQNAAEPKTITSVAELLRDEQGNPLKVVGVIQDITERKRAEAMLHRLNRELRAISNCNQVLMKASDEQTLLTSICRIVCDEAGYHMSCVGYAESDQGKNLRIMAWAGCEEGYMGKAGPTWADTERGSGPAGLAIRSGRPECSHDIASDPRMIPWREDAMQRGYRSCLALPLQDENGSAFGVLVIYSTQINSFTPDEVRLLEELAGDLSYGIMALRARNARNDAQQTAAMLTVALDTVHESAFLTDERGLFTYVNGEACRSLGYSRAELLSLGVADVDPDFPPSRWPEHWQELAEKRSLTFEGRHRAKDGRLLPVEINANYVEYGGQRYNLALVRDLTERRRAEDERLTHFRFFENLDRINRVMHGANTLETMMGDLLEVVLALFACDRALLTCPCDPDAPAWRVQAECNRPELAKVVSLGLDLPMTPDSAGILRTLLDTDGPVQFGPGNPNALSAEIRERFGAESSISMAIHPKVGPPWQFGIYQCSHARVWTEEEERLLQEIGRRLADSMTGLLMYRDLQESERRYRMVFENSPISIWEEDFSGIKALFDDLRVEGVEDIEAYLDWHPETVRRCAELAKVIDVNQAALALHGAASKEMLFAGLTNTFTAESFETFRRELVCLWKGGVEMIGDAVVKTLAGERRSVTVYFSVCPGYEDTLAKVLVSLADITARKQAEEAVLKLNGELELRVGKRTAELEEKNRELERANKLFVGRELRMVELKERIRALENAASAD